MFTFAPEKAPTLDTKAISTRRWLYLAAAIFVICSWFSHGYNQADEHFQILEFAGMKLGINAEEDLAWEYFAQMRPAIQPLMVVAMHKAVGLVGLDNPFIIAWIFRVISAVFSFYVAWLIFITYRARLTNAHWVWTFFLLSFFLWFGIYNGVRFNSETWSANTFAIAVVLQLRWEQPTRRQYLWLGLLVGMAFLFRYQVAFMIAGYGLWLLVVQRPDWKSVAAFTLGGLLPLGLGFGIDRWFYGEWVFTPWYYFAENILEDKAAHFGIDPWWQYFDYIFIAGVPPFSILYMAAIFLFIWWNPRDLLTWISVPFLLVHVLVGHKELRFLYSLLPFLPVAMVLVVQQIARGRDVWQNKTYRWGWKLFWWHNALMVLYISFWGIIPEIDLYKAMYRQYKDPITLYGIEDSPYQMALYVHYYHRPTLCVAEVSSLDRLPIHGQEPFLVAVDRRSVRAEDVPGNKRVVYSSFPEWVRYFNVNNWLRRTQWWMVYEITPENEGRK